MVQLRGSCTDEEPTKASNVHWRNGKLIANKHVLSKEDRVRNKGCNPVMISFAREDSGKRVIWSQQWTTAKQQHCRLSFSTDMVRPQKVDLAWSGRHGCQMIPLQTTTPWVTGNIKILNSNLFLQFLKTFMYFSLFYQLSEGRVWDISSMSGPQIGEQIELHSAL